MKIAIRSTSGLKRYLRTQIENHILLRLRKFYGAIDAVTISLSDINGPRGGFDKSCLAQAVLSDGSVYVASASGFYQTAAAREALAKLVKQIRRRESKKISNQRKKRIDYGY